MIIIKAFRYILDLDKPYWYNPVKIYKNHLEEGRRLHINEYILYITSIPGYIMVLFGILLGIISYILGI